MQQQQHSGALNRAFSDAVMDVAKEAAGWLRDYITAIRSGRYVVHGAQEGRAGWHPANATSACTRRIHPFTIVERKARASTRDEAW
jgi:hypothetical protein